MYFKIVHEIFRIDFQEKFGIGIPSVVDNQYVNVVDCKKNNYDSKQRYNQKRISCRIIIACFNSLGMNHEYRRIYILFYFKWVFRNKVTSLENAL